MEVAETTIHKSFSDEILDSHYLEPGDVCVMPTDPDGTFGVVINSRTNTEKMILVKFGSEPVRDFARTKLQWVGPIV